MEPTSYSNIEALIASQEVRGSSVQATFRCPTTGVEATGNSPIQQGSGVKSNTERSVKRGLWGSLRRAVSSAIADTLGSGTAGRVAREVANSTIREKEQSTKFSKDEIRDAVVKAFDSVRAKFRFDTTAGTWVGVQDPATPFAELLARQAVSETYERGVLARALVEISCADGNLGSDEREFLTSFLDPELGSIEDFAGRDALTAAELEAVSEQARDTILMLSWACALCDEDLAANETARIEELRTGLSIEEARAQELAGMARQFIFDQALSTVYEGGRRDNEAFALAKSAAEGLGIDTASIERFDIEYRKRNGIV